MLLDALAVDEKYSVSDVSSDVMLPTSGSKPISTRETFTPLISRSTCRPDVDSVGLSTDADCSSIAADSASGELARVTSRLSSECCWEQTTWTTATVTPSGASITLRHAGKLYPTPLVCFQHRRSSCTYPSFYIATIVN